MTVLHTEHKVSVIFVHILWSFCIFKSACEAIFLQSRLQAVPVVVLMPCLLFFVQNLFNLFNTRWHNVSAFESTFGCSCNLAICSGWYKFQLSFCFAGFPPRTPVRRLQHFPHGFPAASSFNNSFSDQSLEIVWDNNSPSPARTLSLGR